MELVSVTGVREPTPTVSRKVDLMWYSPSGSRMTWFGLALATTSLASELPASGT